MAHQSPTSASGNAKTHPPKNIKLTGKQAEFLGSIRVLVERNGISPTLEEMGEFAGVSRDTAYGYVRRLIRKGYLERTPGKCRSLKFVK